MGIDRAAKEDTIKEVRETLDEDLQAFHVTAIHEERVEYMLAAEREPTNSPGPLLECLAADITAIAKLLNESPTAVAESVGRMAAQKESVSARWDTTSD